MCFGFGWSVEEISLQIYTDFQLVECTKTLIADMGDPFATFQKIDAKKLDECSYSLSGGSINLQDWEIASHSYDNDVLGGTTGDGVGCWSFAQWTDWAPYVA